MTSESPAGGMTDTPFAALLSCPECGERHYDYGDWAYISHKTHLCARCGHTWRPFPFPTVGVRGEYRLDPIGNRLSRAIAEAITTARIEALREAAGIIAKAEAANRTVINIAHELGHTEIYESLHDVKSALFGARKDIESLITKGTEADSEPSGVSVDPAES